MAPGQTVTHGRIVEYTLSEGDGVAADVVGQQRPAMIVRVWNPEADGNGCANLLVFCDGENDWPAPPPLEPSPAHGPEDYAAAVGLVERVGGGPLIWATSRCFDPDGSAGTWRWPARV